jgi:WhiB family redox-sensing transcriptional regulator
MFDTKDTEWKLKGECVKYDHDLMFPKGEKSPEAQEQIAQAKAVCAICPIAQKCLKWAEDEHEYSGIWGGQTEEERKARRRITQPGMKRKVRSDSEGRIVTTNRAPSEHTAITHAGSIPGFTARSLRRHERRTYRMVHQQ